MPGSASGPCVGNQQLRIKTTRRTHAGRPSSVNAGRKGSSRPLLGGQQSTPLYYALDSCTTLEISCQTLACNPNGSSTIFRRAPVRRTLSVAHVACVVCWHAIINDGRITLAAPGSLVPAAWSRYCSPRLSHSLAHACQCPDTHCSCSHRPNALGAACALVA